tara:strand:- start:181 stop:420 length:240 start_codon:yes stop_codon:yes gene_type:complete
VIEAESSHVIDIWNLFKEYIDKKQIETVAEKYVDACADMGVSDEIFRDSMGSCDHLDAAISYYLDLDEDGFDDTEDEEW